MFKINDVSKTNELKSGKIKKASSCGDFSAYLRETMGSSENQISGLSNIGVSDAIFAAQSVDNEEERAVRKKLVKRGKNLLDKLDEIRSALLGGYISMEKLIDISRFVKEQKEHAEDERLNEIIGEIELRVEVELAKLTK